MRDQRKAPEGLERQYIGSLPLAGHEVKVFIVEDLRDERGEELYGQSNPRDLGIDILAGLPSSVFWDTLVHETTHMVIAFYGLDDRFKDEDDEESFVSVLASGIHQMLASCLQMPRPRESSAPESAPPSDS